MRVLVLPSHVGLGHVARDLAIVRYLRRRVPGVTVEWCSAEPVIGYLRLWGERVIDCGLESFSSVIEGLFNGNIGFLGLGKHLGILERNYSRMKAVLDFDKYDLVFADEFWELLYAAPRRIRDRVVFGTDFVYKPYEINILQSLLSLILNKYFKENLLSFNKIVYLNSLDETPDKQWFLIIGGSVRRWVAENMYVAGLTTSYAPGDPLPSRSEARRRLGLGEDDILIVVSVGGTSARSRHLIEKIVNAYHVVSERLDGKSKMIVVAGPRTKIDADSEDIRVLRMMRSLWDLYVGADLFITRAGRTTTADIECLEEPSPTILVPIKGHFEQQFIAKNLIEKKPEIFMLAREEESPGSIANKIVEVLRGKRRPVNTDRRDCYGVQRTVYCLEKRLYRRG